VNVIQIFRTFSKGLQRLIEEPGECGFYHTVGNLKSYEVMDGHGVVFKISQTEVSRKVSVLSLYEVFFCEWTTTDMITKLHAFSDLSRESEHSRSGDVVVTRKPESPFLLMASGSGAR